MAKKKKKKMWDSHRDEKSQQELMEMWCKRKRDLTKAKDEVYDDLYEWLNTKEGEKTCTDLPDRGTRLVGLK